jgi:murein DD-endopeptidase
MIRYTVFIAIFLSALPTFAQQKTEPTTPIVPNDSVKQEWIDRYLSVAYPLSKIVITSRYGYRRDPFTGKRTLHGGLDLSAKVGEPTYAMLAGVVIKVGSDARSGNFVTIRHGSFTVSYCHLTRSLVTVGTKVRPGNTIALAGNTGRSTGPHLHLTVKYNGSLIDPITILNFISQTRHECKDNLMRLTID